MEKEQHWDNVYAKKPGKNIGWYEEVPEVSLALIDQCNLSRNAAIFVAGAGTTHLIPFLLEKGFSKVIANDISGIALETLAENLGALRENVQFIQDDLTQPSELLEMPPLDLWVDRAVLHFFLEESEIAAYFSLLKEKVKPGGYVLIATFSKDGAKKCTGLPILPYGSEELQARLGNHYTLLKSQHVTHYMPSGDERPYHYALFQKQ